MAAMDSEPPQEQVKAFLKSSQRSEPDNDSTSVVDESDFSLLEELDEEEVLLAAMDSDFGMNGEGVLLRDPDDDANDN